MRREIIPVVLVSAAVAVGFAGCRSAKSSRARDVPVAPLAEIDAKRGVDLTEKREFVKDGYTLRYRLHQPATLEPGTCHPLVLFLHGAGERGNDNTLTLIHGVVPICKYAMKHGDAFVIAPQCPNGKKWVNQDWSANTMVRPDSPSEEMAAVMALLEEFRGNPHVDPSRITVTGISMGGFGTWDIVSRMPGVFAGMMPLCGGVDDSTASSYSDKSLGIRFVHGTADTAVDVGYSRRMDQALTAVGKAHDYIECPGVGHDCWTRAYATDDNLAWLFGNVRR